MSVVVPAMDDDSFVDEDLVVLTPDELMITGLLQIGYFEKEIQNVVQSTNETRFQAFYGCSPMVAAQIWMDLQTTEIDEAHLEPKQRQIHYYLMALNFLKRYPVEIESEKDFRRSENCIRQWKWLMVEKIGALISQVVCWPDDEKFSDDIWVISVDGTHLRTEEPAHPEHPKDPALFSFKHHCAGYNYEIGLSIYESKLIWFSGPHEAGANSDLVVFTKPGGLKEKLEATGKKGIGDGGYSGYPKLLSTPNSHDAPEVAKLKARIRQRHESYNRKLKTFECLDSRFRHSKARLQNCFEAVAVVVQYMMIHGTPLYDA